MRNKNNEKIEKRQEKQYVKCDGFHSSLILSSKFNKVVGKIDSENKWCPYLLYHELQSFVLNYFGEPNATLCIFHTTLYGILVSWPSQRWLPITRIRSYFPCLAYSSLPLVHLIILHFLGVWWQSCHYDNSSIVCQRTQSNCADEHCSPWCHVMYDSLLARSGSGGTQGGFLWDHLHYFNARLSNIEIVCCYSL